MFTVYFYFLAADDISRLLIWLEDRVIRCLPTDARQRDIESEAWTDYVESVCWIYIIKFKLVSNKTQLPL